MPLRARQPSKTSGRRRYRLTAWVAPRLQPKAMTPGVPSQPPIGVALRVGPGLLVQRVDGEDHYLPGLDPRGQRLGHVEILKIEEAAILAGDVQHGAAGVAVYLALHLPAKGGAVILKILHFHGVSSFIEELLPSRLTPCHLPQGGRLKGSLPEGAVERMRD